LGVSRGKIEAGFADINRQWDFFAGINHFVDSGKTRSFELVISAFFDGRYLSAESHVGINNTRQLCFSSERINFRNVGKVQSTFHGSVNVGIRYRGPNSQGNIHRILHHTEVHTGNINNGMVHYAVGVYNGGLQIHISNGTGQSRIIERAIGHFQVQGKGRHRNIVIHAFHISVE